MLSNHANFAILTLEFMWIGLPSGTRLRWHLEIMQYLPLSGWLNSLNSFSFSALELLTFLSDSFGLITLYKQKKGSDSRREKKEEIVFFFKKDGPENTKLKLFHIRSLVFESAVWAANPMSQHWVHFTLCNQHLKEQILHYS